MRRRFFVLVVGVAVACGGPAEPDDPRVSGLVAYEHSAELLAARSLRVTLLGGENELASRVLASRDEGRFDLPIDEDIDGPLAIEVEAVVLDENGAPLIAAASPGDDNRPWSWRFEICAADCERAIDAGDLVIREGAGAARAVDLAAASLERVASHHPEIEPPSVLVLYDETVEPGCGSCYRPLALGGATLASGEAFDTVIELAPDATEATLAHEAAHWIMEAYSRWPGDLSVHDASALARPGVAYTEGFATFYGQATLSFVHGAPVPIARFRTGEVDLERATAGGEPVDAPLASATDDPWATETTVAAVLWAIRDQIGDEALIAAMRSERLLALERDHGRTDLLDLLDALLCDGLAGEATLVTATERFAYPWDPAEARCP